MVLLSIERERCRVTVYGPDPSFTTFVAKIQKAKTRKNRDYFVLRATIPKEAAEKVDANAGDYLLFRVKKAQWYHMLDWETMDNTWKMLPNEIRNRVVMDGLYSRGIPQQADFFGATNLTGSSMQPVTMETNQNGEPQWK